eukprot:scaffold482_cov266-Amphora_coffeaeformis.AAC.36
MSGLLLLHWHRHTASTAILINSLMEIASKVRKRHSAVALQLSRSVAANPGEEKVHHCKGMLPSWKENRSWRVMDISGDWLDRNHFGAP